MDTTTTVAVQVRFTVRDDDGTVFQDALYFTPEAHATLSDKDLAVLQADRYAAWKAIVTAPPRAVTKQEQQAQLDGMVTEKVRLDADIADLTAKIAAAPADVVKG